MSKQILETYLQNGRQFIELAKSVSPQDLAKSPSKDSWSAAFVIHHMADSEMHFATRYLFALADERPAILPFNEEIYPTRLNYAKRQAAASIAAIEGIHSGVVDILHNISDSDWDRISIHPEAGELKLSKIVDKASAHALAHFGQLREVLEQIK
jgi:DinB superfamily